MAKDPIPTVLVTGAAGRVGTLLRAAWAICPPRQFRPLWHGRTALGPDWLGWDMLSAPCPPLAPEPAAILHLAGATAQNPGHLDETLAIARAAHLAAQRFRCRRLFIASSAAVYGPAEGAGEARATAPVTPYGRAKTAMENAARNWREPPVTLLRIANIPGADALLAADRSPCGITLDPAGTPASGPLRSWIGPLTLASALESLISRALAGTHLPDLLNLAQRPPLPMAALLDAAGIDWRFGPPNPGTLGRVTLSTRRLAQTLPPLPTADAAALVAEWRRLA
jgi:hypothetical protein